jgi:hypothetical protein
MSEQKSPFGKYAVIENVRFYFANEPDLWWEIKPPTTGDELALTRFLTTGRATYTADGGVETEGGPSWLDILIFEIALLFGGTNIPDDPDKPLQDGGKPFIKTDHTVDVIQAKLSFMPLEMITEIADKIAEHVPGWGPKNPLGRKEKEE